MNNQPLFFEDYAIAHNGVVEIAGQLLSAFGLHPCTACDSEILGLLVRMYPLADVMAPSGHSPSSITPSDAIYFPEDQL